ncbi:MAG: SpoIIE family protein phosphatase [bacterium]
MLQQLNVRTVNLNKGLVVDNHIQPEEVRQELSNLRAKVEALSSLIEISIIINSTLDLDKLIGLVMEKAQSVMKAEASSVMLIKEDKKILECAVALGKVGDQVKKKMHLQVGEGVAGWVAAHGKPQIVRDVLKDPRFSPKLDKTTGFHTRSILAAPLMVKDKIIGVAEVINRIDGKAFQEDDLELFSTFCRQVAMAIENARMHHLELEKQKLEQQFEAAKIIQQSFMPEVLPSSPSQQFEVAAKSLPAISVGGDFFDFIEFDDHTIGVAVGDVSGKGVPAALFMARLVSDFRIYTQIYKDPSQVLKALNKVLVERSRRGMFVTFQYGLLNASDGRFSYANAGHIPFIRISSKDRTVELLHEASSVPLGILPTIALQEKSIQLNRGDCVVLITDGIIEAKKKSGEAYSLKRTLEMVSKPKQSASEIVERLIDDVQKFSQQTEQHDDLTIVALKWQ